MKSYPISVLMPVYNSDKYLSSAIQSILDQKFKEFELIIVDDGSTDNSIQIIKEAANIDKRIKYLRQPNSGIVPALNKALAVANGKYCARMDADDLSLPDRLREQYEYLELHPEIIALGGQGYIIDGEGDLIRPLLVLTDHESIYDDLLNRFNSKAMINPSVMFRTDEVRKIGGYTEGYIVAEDLDLFLRMAEVGKLANLESVVLYYRKHGNSISDTKSLLMRKSAMTAANQARARRGIPTIVYPEPITESAVQSRLDYLYSTGVVALRNGWKKTSIKYLKKIFLEFGLSPQFAKLSLKLALSVLVNIKT